MFVPGNCPYCGEEVELDKTILDGLAAQPAQARAEQFRVALSTKDFGYLPLFVGIRAGLFAQETWRSSGSW